MRNGLHAHAGRGAWTGRFTLPRRARLAVGVALWLGTFLLYAKSLAFDFIDFDTKNILLAHPQLYDETSLLGSIRQNLYGYFPREEPLVVRDLSWAIDSRVFGFRNPLGYHLGNVLLNAFNTSLVFSVIVHSTGRPLLAFASAVLFSVVPVHVQAVCWEMSRKDLLVTFFMLVGLQVQCAALARSGTRAGRKLDVLVVLISLLAILSKFNAIVYFALLALHRVMFPYISGQLAPDASFDLRAAVRKAAPTLLPMVAISAVIYSWYKANLTALGVLGDRGAPTLSLEHLETLSVYIPLTLAKSAGLILWPFGHSIMYHRPNTNLAPTTAELTVAYAFCAALALAVLYVARRRKDILFVLLSAGALMLPYLNIQYIGYWVADRYLYFVALCPIVLLVASGIELARRSARLAPVLALAAVTLALFYGGRTFVLQDAFRNNLSLWRHEVALDEPSVLAFQALAKETVHRAKQAEDDAERRRWLHEAKDASTRGLAYYDAQSFRSSSYRRLELLHASSMLLLRGTAAALEGEPLEVELGYYLKAHATAVSSRTAIALADACMRLAGRLPDAERRAMLRKSLKYFEKYLEMSHRDVARHPPLRSMLVDNYGRFAFLRDDIIELEQRYLR